MARPSLYEGAARPYVEGRMPYPAALFDALRRHLGLTGAGRALDVGCGPGSLTLGLAPLFASVVAVDADPGMLAEGREQAARAGLGNIDWRLLRAEALPAGLGTFDLIICAQAFHWLDRPRVARAMRSMLAAQGRCVLVSATTHRGTAGIDRLPHPRPPHEAIAALVKRRLEQCGVTPPSRPPAVGSEETVMRAAGFGPDREAFEADLRTLLRAASPSGRFSERRRSIRFDVYR